MKNYAASQKYISDHSCAYPKLTAEAIAASRLPLRIRLPPAVSFRRHEGDGDELDDSKQERSLSPSRDSPSMMGALRKRHHTHATKRKERASAYRAT